MMDLLGEDEIFSIFERIPNREGKQSFSKVCKRFLKVACFHFRSLDNQLPDLLCDILIASPRMVLYECHKTLTNNHMKLIAKSCPNIKDLNLSSSGCIDHAVGKLEFDDAGLCAIADACIQLIRVNLSGRLRFTEIGIGSLIRSCKNLKVLTLSCCCLNVTDKSLKVIGEATRIERLFLDGCYLISDLGLEYLADGNLKYCLERLTLKKCDRITDNGIVHLKKLVSLRSLDLSNCGTNFTSAGLRAFSGHQRLTQLCLFSCDNISWEDVKSVALTCGNLIYLQLSRRIKKPMPKAGYDYSFPGYNNRCTIKWN